MRHISESIKSLAVLAALSPKNKSEKKERIMLLYESDLITSSDAILLIKEEGLKNA